MWKKIKKSFEGRFRIKSGMTKGESGVARLCGVIEKYEWGIGVVLIASLLRIPSLFEPDWYGDESIYLAVGQGLRRGLQLYSGIFDHKPPLIYWLAAISGKIWWFKLWLFPWNAISIMAVYVVARKLFRKEWLRVLLTLGFGLVTTLPWIEGNIVNAELLFIMPVLVVAAWLVGKKFTETRWWEWVVMGILLSVAVLFKIPVVFDVFAIGLWLVLFQDNMLSLRGLRGGLLMVLGFVIPVALVAVYFASRGQLAELIYSGFLINFGYIASWSSDAVMSASSNTGLVNRGVATMLGTALVWWMTRGAKREIRLVLVWFLWSLFGSLLSARPYPHYLIQVVPATCLLLGIVIDSQRKGVLVAAVGLLATLVMSVIVIDFYFYPTLKYYKNFGLYATGEISKEEWGDRFDGRVSRDRQIGEYIVQRTDPDERILVWGDDPAIYLLSERLPAGRHVMTYHVEIFGRRKEEMASIQEKKPTYIVWLEGAPKDFKELNEQVAIEYIEVAKFKEATVLRKRAW